MGINLWFEHVIDAYLSARAQGRDWRTAVATAEQFEGPRRVLTRHDLKARKGIAYSRQHLAKKVKGGGFPKPFQSDPNWARPASSRPKPSKKAATPDSTAAAE
jgi:hypothetical protein